MKEEAEQRELKTQPNPCDLAWWPPRTLRVAIVHPCAALAERFLIERMLRCNPGDRLVDLPAFGHNVDDPTLVILDRRQRDVDATQTACRPIDVFGIADHVAP